MKFIYSNTALKYIFHVFCLSASIYCYFMLPLVYISEGSAVLLLYYIYLTALLASYVVD